MFQLEVVFLTATKLTFSCIRDVHQCLKIIIHKTLSLFTKPYFPTAAGQLFHTLYQEAATLVI